MGGSLHCERGYGFSFRPFSSSHSLFHSLRNCHSLKLLIELLHMPTFTREFVESKRIELEKKLDFLVKNYKSNKDEYVDLWKNVCNAGFRISRGLIANSLKHCIKAKKRGLEAPWRCLNLSPDQGSHGDCTTRALAYCFPEIGYHTLKLEQKRLSKMTGRAWNNCEVWHRVAFDHGGYEFFKLRVKRSRANVARSLKDLKSPILARSSGHVAVIHHGEVVDSWDSRNGRILELGFKNKEDVEMAKSILGIGK